MNTIIPNNATHENQIQTLISTFFKEIQLGKLLKSANANKGRGISSTEIFKIIFALVFAGKGLLRFLQTVARTQVVGKDAVYRFLNSPHTNWRNFLFLLSSLVVFKKFIPLTAPERVDVLFIDASLYSRGRSKRVELLRSCGTSLRERLSDVNFR